MNDQFDSNSAPIEDWEISLPELTAEEKDRLLEAIKPVPSAASAPEQIASEPDFMRTMTGTREDWGMTEPLEKPPVSPPQSEWILPPPVFRSSEGFTPKKFVEAASIKVDSASAAPTAAPVDFAEIPAPPLPSATSAAPDIEQLIAPVTAAAAPAAKIEPQPDIIEEFPAPPIAGAPVAVKAKSGAWRIVSIIFGLLAMFAFGLGFLALIYFLFFYKAAAE